MALVPALFKKEVSIIQRLEIPFRLPSLNDIIASCRYNKFAAASQKKKTQKDISLIIKFQHIKPVIQAKFEFIWTEKKARKQRDKDNISSGGRKFILDALVEMGILKDDGWKEVIGWTDHFYLNKETKVDVIIDDMQDSRVKPSVPVKEFMEEFETECSFGAFNG